MTTPSSQTVLITGAGSGVGRAVAIRFAAASWNVVLVGRRAEALQETAELGGGNCVTHVCDIGDEAQVQGLAATFSSVGVDAVVNCAGTNVSPRSWAGVSSEDYHAVLATNLHGPFYLAKVFMPALRASLGTVVNINSDAGIIGSEKAGVPYVTSKFGLRGLTQSINAEERRHGVRAVSISPGDINTPLLDRRPVPPSAEIRAKMLQAEDVAEAVWFAVTLPGRALVEEIVIRPTEATT
ncbi:SDR family oxidoreductase [Synoicihabitans lomoniglobus]|uniref:SDR family NAD(P)-dependent oxidoreductase n=1 Tax=Synoicihabitans lomoniglobus TaxID=2909285 RepID=A0AAE9ZX70_9BACT|nr:SDR family oxidoreductase [Opitutaceae bacterium LMO-M01]WED64854.1 SDR family NAD(P)-dependent oxidoreductase [Opitutaceae bacterium LMO-M01]